MTRRHSTAWHRLHDQYLAERALQRRAEAPGGEEGEPAPNWESEPPPRPGSLAGPRVAELANALAVAGEPDRRTERLTRRGSYLQTGGLD